MLVDSSRWVTGAAEHRRVGQAADLPYATIRAMVVLSKGANCSVPAVALVARLSWSNGADADVSALLLGSAGQIRNDDDFVFFNQPRHSSGAVAIRNVEAKSAVELAVDLPNIESAVDRVIIASSTDGSDFGAVHDLTLALVDPSTGEELVRFEDMRATTETALVAGELYRRAGTWKFRAVGQGWAAGLAGLASSYGITVEDEGDRPDEPLLIEREGDAVPAPAPSAPEAAAVVVAPMRVTEEAPAEAPRPAGRGSTMRPIVGLAREVRARLSAGNGDSGAYSTGRGSAPAVAARRDARPSLIEYRPPGFLWPSLEVVGESHYRAALQRVVGRLKEWETRESEVDAVLVPEPKNRFDKDAVAVQIRGAVVGYLGRDDARAWKPVLDRIHAAGAVLTPRARVWGQNRPADSGGFLASVRLALPSPDLALPLDAPPPRPHSVLPWGSRLKLTGAASVLTPLAKYLGGRQEGLLLVSLHHRRELLQNGSERSIVDALMDDQVLAGLSPASSRNIAPSIDHLQERGLETVAWATLRGTALAIDLGLQAAKSVDLTAEWMDADPATVPTFY